jgi:hypothetical protein
MTGRRMTQNHLGEIRRSVESQDLGKRSLLHVRERISNDALHHTEPKSEIRLLGEILA